MNHSLPVSLPAQTRFGVLRAVFFGLIATLAIQACGNRGALYIPGEATAPPAAAAAAGETDTAEPKAGDPEEDDEEDQD